MEEPNEPETRNHQSGRRGGAGLQVAVQGVGKGLVAALGCWWSDKKSSAICMLVEEASSNPVAKHLGQLAKIAVPKFQ